MKRIFSTTLIAIFALSMHSAQASNNLHSFVKEIMQTINNSGQDGLCVKSGILRKSIISKGSVLPQAGGICKYPDLAYLSIAACSGYQDRDGSFADSQCAKNAKSTLNTQDVNTAVNYLIRIMKEESAGLRNNKQDVIEIVCNTPENKLKGGLLSARAACPKDGAMESGTSRPRSNATATPTAATNLLTLAQKQKMKASIQRDLQTVEALKTWVWVKPTTERGNVMIGAQRGLTIKAPQPTEPAQKTSLLQDADKLAAALKKMNQVLDGKEMVKPNPALEAKLDNFSSELTSSQTINEMQKRLNDLEKMLAEMEAED